MTGEAVRVSDLQSFFGELHVSVMDIIEKQVQPCMGYQPAVNLFYTPVEDGTYYVITRGGQAGGVPHSLSGAYLQDYSSYGYETSWVDRSHQGGVQCTGTITLACLIF